MFELPKLNYQYNDLEPYIDATTMEIHYTKHHNAYITNLNKALETLPEWQNKSIEEILQNLNQFPEQVKATVQNNAGGHYNHTLFWKTIDSANKVKPLPEGALLQNIEQAFGTFENFKTIFTNAALTRFGSGWAWLYLDSTDKTLKICSTPNQDNTLMQNNIPLLGLDVWEHAYYLKYQNKRADYINNWWHIVNWEQVEKNFIN